MKLQLNIATTKLGGGHFALTKVADSVVRGRRAEDEVTAVRNLLWKLAGQEHQSADEMLTLLELALAGTTLEQQLALAEANGSDD